MILLPKEVLVVEYHLTETACTTALIDLRRVSLIETQADGECYELTITVGAGASRRMYVTIGEADAIIARWAGDVDEAASPIGIKQGVADQSCRCMRGELSK